MTDLASFLTRGMAAVSSGRNGYGDMVIMSMEIYENIMRQLSMYRDIEISEKQIENRQIKDAKTALTEMRTKYGL